MMNPGRMEHIKKIVGISYSYADNSMNKRGLQLMKYWLEMDVYGMTDFNMPMCNRNKSDGKVPYRVHSYINVLKEADILIFAIPEATGHYCSGFKNAMDWLICASKFNADLGQDSAFFNKPIYVMTFTPSHTIAGGRHFKSTTHLLSEKMGGWVVDCFVKHSCWEKCIPGNYEWLRKECDIIKRTETPKPINRTEDLLDRPEIWMQKYNEWDKLWLEKT